MSTHWGYRCTVDGAESGREMNHGQGTLREMVKAGPALVMLEESGVDLDVTHFMGGVPIGFLRRHGNHLLELINEYGGVEPIDEPCGTEHGALPGLFCERSAGHFSHFSRHEGVWEVASKTSPTIRHQSRVTWDSPVKVTYVMQADV